MRVSYSAASPASHTANGLWKLSSKEKRLARIWPLQPFPAHSRTLPRSNTTPRRSTWPKAFLHQAWQSSRRPEEFPFASERFGTDTLEISGFICLQVPGNGVVNRAEGLSCSSYSQIE